MRTICSFLLCLFAVVAIDTANAQGVSPSAAPQKALDGWGRYKFGMTVDQARAVGGISWKKAELQVTKLGNLELRWWHLDSESTQTIDGKNYRVRLSFKPDTGLHWIHLNHAGIVTTASDCLRVFQEVVQELEQRHGVFGATNDAQPEKDTGFGKRKVEIKNLPKSKSKYGLRTETIQLKPADPARTYLFAESLKTFGKTKISIVSSIESSSDGCKLEIVYTDRD